MTKTIIDIVQNDSGGTNPDTHAHEDKIWDLIFDDGDTTSLTRMKMMELLTTGTVPTKTVHTFKKWDLTTTQEEKEKLKELRTGLRENYVPVFGKKEDTILEEEIT